MGKLYFSHSLALPSISHLTWWSRARAKTCKMDMVRIWDLSLSIGLEHSWFPWWSGEGILSSLEKKYWRGDVRALYYIIIGKEDI